MTQIPSDDILESLYKLRIRESSKFKTVLELYNMEIHQKKAGLDYHRLKTMVKRNIEQSLRSRILNQKRKLKKQTRWSRIRGQNSVNKELWENCWQWEVNGQYSKGDNCSFRHDISTRAEPPQPNPYPESSTRQSVRNASRTRSPRGRSPSGKMARLPCNDYLKGPSATPFLWKMAPSRMLVLQVRNW